jgi:hypothetical protein
VVTSRFVLPPTSGDVAGCQFPPAVTTGLSLFTWFFTGGLRDVRLVLGFGLDLRRRFPPAMTARSAGSERENCVTPLVDVDLAASSEKESVEAPCDCSSKGEPGIILYCVLGLIHYFCLDFNVVLKSNGDLLLTKGFFFRVLRISLFCLALRPGVLKSTDKPDCLGPPYRVASTLCRRARKRHTLSFMSIGGTIGQLNIFPGHSCKLSSS